MDLITAAVEEALRIDDDWRQAMRRARSPRFVRQRCQDCRGKGVIIRRLGLLTFSDGITCETCHGDGEL